MPTAPKTISPTEEASEAAAEASAAQGRLFSAGRKLAVAYLDGVEAGVSRLARIERTVAGKAPSARAASLVTAHADLSEKVAKFNVSTLRDLVA